MDDFTQNPALLGQKPKETVGNYVESNGVLVPRRFSSLRQARNSGLPILLRSEHIQDYNGVSGLLSSFSLPQNQNWVGGLETIADVKNWFFDQRNGHVGISSYRRYCDILGIQEATFRDATTFSIWEHLGGFNRSIVADTAIKGRHHIMTYRAGKNGSFSNYLIAQDGGVLREWGRKLPDSLRSSLHELIESYEIVRGLGRFDPNHCPIMEFQTDGDDNYFLQYHRSRDFSGAGFVLDRGPQKDEVVVPFVRGSTPPDGVICKVSIYYPHFGPLNSGRSLYDYGGEEGSYDFHSDPLFAELKYREREVQLISNLSLGYALMRVVVGHRGKSSLFKPKVSIIHDMHDILSRSDLSVLRDKSSKGEHTTINVRVISDGKKAFISKI